MTREPIGLVCDGVGVERWVANEHRSGASLVMRATHPEMMAQADGYELRLSRDEVERLIELLAKSVGMRIDMWCSDLGRSAR